MKPGDSPQGGPEERELPALAWMRRAHAQDELLREVRTKVKRRRGRRLAAAGICAGAIFAAVLGVRSNWPTVESARTPALVANATATVFQPRLQVLADGSTVELKEGAHIEVDFSGTFRRVKLTSGEAHFQVAKDKARPFIVSAGQTEVRAVGTAFSVLLASEAVDVVVTEGSVRVGAGTEKAGEPALVGAGNRCVVAADLRPLVQPVSGTEAGERLAWRVTQLEFSRTPLTEVVSLMNRHAPVEQRMRFEIADAELNAIKLTGFLRADNIEGLVRLLENNFHVRSEQAGERIVLRKGS